MSFSEALDYCVDMRFGLLRFCIVRFASASLMGECDWVCCFDKVEFVVIWSSQLGRCGSGTPV